MTLIPGIHFPTNREEPLIEEHGGTRSLVFDGF